MQRYFFSIQCRLKNLKHKKNAFRNESTFNNLFELELYC